MTSDYNDDFLYKISEFSQIHEKVLTFFKIQEFSINSEV